MKPLLSSLVILGVLGVTGAAAAAQGQPGQVKPVEPKPGDRSLFIGDAAPPLTFARWVRGEPVKQLDKGTIYVVEFWATWCGPCVQSIPHVTRLQERYRDQGVVVVGIGSVEPDGAVKVPPFVARFGERMNYRVAVDDYAGTKEGRTYTAWVKASGNDGIPCAFVVGRDGRVAWVGDPRGMDDALAKIVAGTFDPVKEFGGRDGQRLMARASQTTDPAEADRIWDEAARLPEPPPGINAERIALLGKVEKKDVGAAYGVLERAVAAPARGCRTCSGRPRWCSTGGSGTPTPTGCSRFVDRAATLPGDDADRVNLLVGAVQGVRPSARLRGGGEGRGPARPAR